MKLKKCTRICLVALGTFGVVVLFFGFLGVQLKLGNFHPIIEGEAYRSAQLRSGDIAKYHAKYGIRSVLNLRGENTGKSWYDTERGEAMAVGVQHIDFRMSADRELTNEQALALIEIMRNAPKPLLIHCRSGSDRTGLASAFYVAAIAKKGEWAAERQLWVYYGHFPFMISSAVAMNRTFERLEPILGFEGS